MGLPPPAPPLLLYTCSLTDPLAARSCARRKPSRCDPMGLSVGLLHSHPPCARRTHLPAGRTPVPRSSSSCALLTGFFSFGRPAAAPPVSPAVAQLPPPPSNSPLRSTSPSPSRLTQPPARLLPVGSSSTQRRLRRSSPPATAGVFFSSASLNFCRKGLPQRIEEERPSGLPSIREGGVGRPTPLLIGSAKGSRP
ncbi:unnamed protein product [Victoria cruziana]